MPHKMKHFGTEIKCDECKQPITGDIWHVCNDREIEALGQRTAKWLCLECLLILQLRR